MKKSSRKDSGYNIALSLLNKNIVLERFISPKMIAKAYNLAYSEELLQHFIKTLPSKEVLQWIRENDFRLIAGPPNPMSLWEILNLDTRLFEANTYAWLKKSEWLEKNSWLNKKGIDFQHNDKVTSEWLMINRGITPNSEDKTWSKQIKILTKKEYVPNVAEVAWCEVVNMKIYDYWLCYDELVRTSSKISHGNHVVFGRSTDTGTSVGWIEDFDEGEAGLASALKRM